MAKQFKKPSKNIPSSTSLTHINSFLQKLVIPVLFFIIFIIIVFIGYELLLQDKFILQSFIGDTNISFLTRAQATQVLAAKFNKRKSQKLSIGEQDFTINLATASAKFDYSVVDLAFEKGHTGSLSKKISDQIRTLIFKSDYNPNIFVDLSSQTKPIAKAVFKPPTDAQISFSETVTEEGTPSASIQIKEGRDGIELDLSTLEENIIKFLAEGNFDNQLPVKNVPPKITTDQVKRAKEALEISKNDPVILKFAGDIWTIDTKQLLTILDLTKGQGLLLDKDKTLNFLQNIASQIDQPVTEGQFDFDPATKRATNFKPSQEGRKLDIDKAYSLLIQAYNGEVGKTITFPVDVVKPKVLTEDVNNLGIKEQLGQGISYFAGSIANRIYNIGLAASRINGVLITPGEIFSFNQIVGDITAATGFKQAYVIKEGRTVLDDGGGVCQVSTTLFRAVLNSGLPVIKRTAHAYRVGYYEQGFPPGLDATVYYPSVDFQFKNDTQAHVLIQAYISGNGLFINLYGTSDGRIAKLTTPVIKNQTPPPPELRQDDPTLPRGTVKQADWAAWGANVSFNRTVTRGSETLIKETWYSNFKPWQAVFLVGTQ